jgi:hypothetical protein
VGVAFGARWEWPFKKGTTVINVKHCPWNYQFKHKKLFKMNSDFIY